MRSRRHDANMTTKTRHYFYLHRFPEHAAIIVHNRILPQRPSRRNGFRAWVELDPEMSLFVRCRCDLDGCKNQPAHYRLKKRAVTEARKSGPGSRSHWV